MPNSSSLKGGSGNSSGCMFHELPYSLFCIVVIQNSACFVKFKTIKKDRHRLPNDAGIVKKQLRTTVAAVVRAQVSGNK